MSIDPQHSSPPTGYTGKYYALPLRGRLTPYEGGAFSAAPGAIPEGDAKTAEKAEKKAGFSFAGFLDMINPLQHIPIVSSLYRRITGDELTPVGRIAGDTLFFGAIGFATSLVNTAIEKLSGKDVGDHVMTAMLGEKDKAADPLDPSPIPDAAQRDADDGANNVLAAIAKPDAPRGTVTVHPKGGVALAPLDAATLDALARTMGSAEPLAHLAAPVDQNTNKNKLSAVAKSSPDGAAAIMYNDALIRMQQGLEQYQTQRPNPALTDR